VRAQQAKTTAAIQNGIDNLDKRYYDGLITTMAYYYALFDYKYPRKLNVIISKYCSFNLLNTKCIKRELKIEY